MNEAEYPCPCCGFLVFGEPPGSYDICAICNWEDDHVQLRHPHMGGGANKESLWQAQQIWIAKIPIEIGERQGFQRDKQWRPLTMSDVDIPAPRDGRSYFEDATADAPVYYWLS